MYERVGFHHESSGDEVRLVGQGRDWIGSCNQQLNGVLLRAQLLPDAGLAGASDFVPWAALLD